MADKKTVDKVKEMLDGHVYAPLRNAAEKWLEEADAKYDVKDKANKAWDKIGDAADSISDASMKFNEKMNAAGDKFTEGAEKLADKAAPVIDDLKDKAAPKIDELKGKAAETELVAKLKEGISTVNETIEHFSDPKVRESVGEETAEKIKAHAEALKAEGKTYCDCPACTKAKEILTDLGEDIGE